MSSRFIKLSASPSRCADPSVRPGNEFGDISLEYQGFNQIKTQRVDDPALASVYERGMSDPDSLTRDEQYQFVWLMRCYVNIFESLYQQFVSTTPIVGC
jgi:hypothetical protein